jgi:DNA-binding CsgD family transcriptional regulator
VASDLEADRLLAAASRAADPIAAARLVAEAFLAVSRTAEPATLTFLVRRLEVLRGSRPVPETELLFHTVAGVVGVRTRQPFASRHLEDALRLFAEHRLHDDGLFVECALMCTVSLIRPHDARPNFAHLLDGLDVDVARRARLVAMIALGDAWSGDLVRGRAGLVEGRRLALAAGRPDIQAETTSWLAKVEAWCGDLGAAAGFLAEARELAARAGSSWVAGHIAECAEALHQVSGDTEAWLGVLELLVNTTVGANSGLIFEHRWELATHHALRGDQVAAQALLAGVPDPPLAWPGAPALPAWRAWIGAPADPQAMAWFEESLQGLNRPVERMSRARMAWLLGAQHARLGRRADAIRLLEAAGAGYAACGAGGPLARVMDQLNDVAVRGPAVPAAGPLPTPRDGQLPLTATEARVALAVAAGLSNREVADRLSVSTKTVEFHLGNIFRKLGVRNRTELATRRPQVS